MRRAIGWRGGLALAILLLALPVLVLTLALVRDPLDSQTQMALYRLRNARSSAQP
jgi:hypothetical protein